MDRLHLDERAAVRGGEHHPAAEMDGPVVDRGWVGQVGGPEQQVTGLQLGE